MLVRTGAGAGVADRQLRGKVALVTGGARGLGRGYALRLAELGADVAILDRNLDAAGVYEFERNLMTAATVQEECAAHGVRALQREVDLADRGAAERAVAGVAGELGGIDIAVCNAGGGTTRFADEMPGAGSVAGAEGRELGDANTEATASDCPQEVLTRVLDINLMTCMYTCMAVVSAPETPRRRQDPSPFPAPRAWWLQVATTRTAPPRPLSSTTRGPWPRNWDRTASTSTASRPASSAPGVSAIAPTSARASRCAVKAPLRIA